MSVEYDGIAIIGMAGRFPGAENVEEFWRNLVSGKESVSFFSDAELAASGLDPSELRRRGQYVPARGVLNQADCFDAAFFGVHPKEAEVMEPQQRVFLEICWAALERAGYAPGRTPAATAVFAGASRNTYYLNVLHSRPDLLELVGPEMVMYGNEKDYLTTRVAYKLGLKGSALNVSTACSTSLVAVCQACQSLLTYQCDMALAGGVSVMVPQQRGYFYDEGNIGSPDGHTRTFDAQAAGTVFSNGVAVVVLKRLADAVADGDEIFAVIKGAALNNDGSQRVSFGAPGVEGQAEVIAMAHALAGVDPETITCIEAHGTATPLGDPIEVSALTKAFRLGTTAKQFCALGSVKTNIGHLDVAAGVTGLIKMALCLHHQIIPASLHYAKPNPKLNLEESPFYVNASLQRWKTRSGIPRRGGVSSFGTGGTNAHVVVEEGPSLPPGGPSRPWQLLLWSSKTPDALERMTLNLAGHLKSLAAGPDRESLPKLADVAFTLQTGRSEFTQRRMLVCRDPAEGAEALSLRDPKRVFSSAQRLRQPPVVFMFPGQGAQYAGMGAELYRVEPVFRAAVDECASLLAPILETDLRDVVFPPSGSEKATEDLLVQTKFTQPALFVIEYSLAKLWMSWGITPASMIGHSVGEFVAACLSGVVSLPDALSLVARRGALVQTLPGGAMLVVRQPELEVLPLLNADLAIAAINSPNLCVVAGPHDAIASLERELGSRGITTRRLPTSHAFHSPMMDPAVAPFRDLLCQVKFDGPRIPYISNVTAQWVTPEQAKSIDYWAAHLRQTVRFADGVAELLKDSRNVLLEVGPGQTLSTLARQHSDKCADQIVLASLPLTGALEQRGILESLGRLWLAGADIDWHAFYAGENRRRTVLPSYPFERTRYWPDSPETNSQSTADRVNNGAVKVAGLTNAASHGVQSAGIASAVAEIPQVDHAAVPPVTFGPATVAPAIPRKERLLTAARALLQNLSGSDLSTVDTSANLLELGLDSLLLTQASHLFQRKFGVAMSFRQLMEELSSLNDIAAYLDAAMPPHAFAAPPPALAAPSPVSMSAPSIDGDAKSVLERLLLQQQELTNQVLQALGRTPAQVPDSGPVFSPFEQVLPGVPPVKSHGPFKPIDKSAGHLLSDNQSRALNSLIARYTARTSASKKLTAENRPVLADPRSVAGFNRLWKEMVYPISTIRSDGSRVWDVDGNEYIDFVMGFGSSMFGHRPPFVVRAVQEQLDLGFEIGPIQPLAGEVAALLKELTGMDRVGFTNTGSEAVLAATRIARTVTGRDKIIVFAGAYHGIFDEVLFRPHKINGEAAAAAIAPGIPASALGEVIVLDYGNPQSFDVLRRRGSEIAAVLVEPVQSRRLDLQPREFLHELRRVTQEIGAALVFDEIVTGFRLHPGGAQAYFDVRADIATYGKVFGGGLPIGAVAGSPRFMDALDGGQWQYGDNSFPEIGVTFFAGTFMRHPLALAAAKAVLTHLKQSGPELQQNLTARTAQLAADLRPLIEELDAPYTVTQFMSLIQIGFPPDQKFAGLLFYLLRERGIHIYENRAFVMTTAHTEADTAGLLVAFRESLAEMKAGDLLPPSGSSPNSSKKHLTPAHKQEAGQEVPVGSLAQASLAAPFPLTEAQTEIWLGAQMSVEAAVAYNESLSLRFGGSFDVESFRSAVHVVLERHPILLASISADGQTQAVNPGAMLEVPFIDLSALDPSRREKELASLVERETTQPFDLAAGPLLRVNIVRLASDAHVVLWTAHHIVCDGWSAGVLLSELAAIYSASKQGIAPSLEAPQSFREYVEKTAPGTPAARASVAYWKQQFADLPASLDLPTDRPRPPFRSARADTAKKVLGAPLHRSLKRVAGQQRTTIVVLLMAALETLLYRLTGQEDIVLGLGAAGQATTGTSCLVGHCLNLLPVRTKLQSETGFDENLKAVKKSVLDAYDHSESTVGGLLRELAVSRDPSRSPLIEVLFNLDRDTGATQFSGAEVSIDRNAKRALHFDLFFNFVESPRGLDVGCDYNTDLFSAATIERWLGHCQTLLEGIAANPAEKLSRLPILTPQEIKRITIDWNATAVEYPLDRCLFEFIEAQVERTPEAPALIFENQTISYRQLNSRANQLGHYLRARGVGPEKLVPVCAERSLEMVVAVLAIIKAGGAYVPLDPWYPAERLALLLADIQAPLVLTQQKFVAHLPETSPLFALDSNWLDVSSYPETNPARQTSPQNAAYVIYTSGSTGQPKGVINIHQGIVNRLLWMQDAFNIGPSDCILQKTPFTFDVSVWEFFWPLMTGACLVMAKPEGHKDPDYLVSVIARERISTLHFVPSMLEVFLESGGLENLHSVSRVICSGEALSYAVQQRFFALFKKAELHNLYGPTEAAVDVTYWPCRKNSDYPFVPIGKPIANTQIYVVDQHLNPVPIGIPGELHIGGAGVARGYLNRNDLTGERFIPDTFAPNSAARLYKTGDTVRFLADGNIEYLGRMDNQVKLRGQRIELGEIEFAIREQSGIRQTVVVVREDRPGDKLLVAYIVAQPGSDTALEGLLRAALKRKLPGYMLPAAFVRLQELPLTRSGKIDRKALPPPSYGAKAVDLQRQNSQAASVPVDNAQPSRLPTLPRTDTDKSIAAMWSDVLNIENIPVDSDFFELGGHSLLAIRVVSRIRDHFGVSLSPRAFFANPTIAALAKAVDEAKITSAEKKTRIKRRAQSGPPPLSLAQERLWFLDQLTVGSPVYNIVDVVEFASPSDPEIIKRALNELVRRHEILRTAFSENEGQPVQIVNPTLDVRVSEVDLSAVSQQDREKEWTRIAREQGRQTFDLSKPPLLRATLARTAQQEHLLLLALHHIVADEWSMEILHRELHCIYAAFSRQQPSPLPDLPIQFADFALWQREWLQPEILDRQAAFWKRELAGAPTTLELPTDRSRPALQTFRGSAEAIQLPKDLLDSLKSLGRREHATMFMTLLASFMALLHRYTGQNDILVGTPISGRTLSETENLIGFFLNTIVLRGKFTDDSTFRALLQQVRERALGAYAHQEFPFGQLVADLAPDRDPSHSPLIQVMFILQNAGAVSQASKVAGIQKLETGTSKFDLTLFISETGEGLDALIEYNTDLFDPATIQRLLGHYQILLGALVRNPDQAISTLPLLTSAERKQLLLDWNNTEVAFAQKTYNLHQLFEEQARKTPSQIALVFEKRRWTYRELDERSNRIANYLQKQGVAPGVLVGILLDRSAEMVAALLGILKAGGAYVPLDPSFPRNRLAHMIEDSAMRVLVTHHRLDQKLAVKPALVVRLDVDAQQINNLPATSFQSSAADLAYVLYTSGSTGIPKGVEIPHSAIVNFVLSMQQRPGFTSADILLAVTTLSFDIAGLEVYLPLISGGKVVIASRDDSQDPARLIQQIRDSGCTIMQATPATWRALIDAGWSGSRTLKILCGGEACPPELARQLISRCAELWNMYGPTETTVWSTIHHITSAEAQVPIGRPIANTQTFVLDAHRNLLPVGVVGELYIGGHGVARGYLNRPELTRERFVPNPFDPKHQLYRTGDLARWLPEGVLECLGRVDNQVKIRGFRIELGEIESVLARHNSIHQCVVVAREAASGEKILAAYFEAGLGPAPDVADLRAHLKTELPDYMIPSVFVPMEKLPLTPNGKIDRQALPASDRQRVDVGSAFVAPRDATERSLVEIWTKVLKVPRVGIHDNFFELGGHSLLALRIIVEIEKLYNQRLPLATLLQAPVITDLAKIVRDHDKKPSWTSLVPIRPGGSRSPLFLMHSHGGNVLEYYPLANLLDSDQPVYGVQARGLDGNIARNQSLEAITKLYVTEIKAFQPHGPYFLGGFCFGGLLALEAAQQLSAAGEEVALLVLLQTTNPAFARFAPGLTPLQRFWYRASKRINLERENLAHRGASYFQDRFEYGWNRVWARTAIAMDHLFRNGTAGQTRSSMPYILESLTIEHDRMAEEYKIRPYSGDVVLFRASKQLNGLIADRLLGWRNILTGNVTVCEVSGHQQNILLEPNVGRLAKDLSLRLQTIQRELAAD